jgi:activator of HSP90 ATPase
MKNLTKKYIIDAPVEKVYEALTDADLIEQWSGAPAIMEPKPGGVFSLWNSEVYGKNRQVRKNKIIQEWIAEDWEDPTKVTFILKRNGYSTVLELKHENIPENSYELVEDNWDNYYLNPLRKLLECSSV